MNGFEDTIAIAGCGVALLIAWHVMRHAGPRGPSRLARVSWVMGWTLETQEKAAADFRRNALPSVVIIDGPRRPER
jgi:hypothetical protein